MSFLNKSDNNCDRSERQCFATLLFRPLVICDIFLLFLALIASYALRFNFSIPETHMAFLPYVFPFVVGVEILLMAFFGSFRSIWRFFSSRDLPRFIYALLLSSVIFLICRFIFDSSHIKFYPPISINLMNFVLALCFVTGVRLFLRTISEERLPAATERKRVVIVGADNSGTSILYSIRHSASPSYECIGFVDYSDKLTGSIIQGVPVLGSIDSIYELLKGAVLDEVIIPTGMLSRDRMQQLSSNVSRLGARLLVAPGFSPAFVDFRADKVIRDADITDILKRNEVALSDLECHRDYISGKRIMITGAGGSIGSEIVRQVVMAGAASVILVERSELAIFEIVSELDSLVDGERLYKYIADIGDEKRIASIIADCKPEIIFHAAAYKHVSLMEENPCEAIKNNVFGTYTLAKCALEGGVKSFVLLSSDKAVKPSSVMGATKRLCELIIQSMNGKETSFSAVRFGNVLGSTGSVVPIFSKQIAAGGPVTITHPDMERFFMTVPEAVSLTIVASSMASESEGDVFILDMGSPLRIVTLAEEMIRLAGKIPGEDIPIVFTGIRQGEKLSEILVNDNEVVFESKHSEISCARLASLPSDRLSDILAQLRESVSLGDDPAAKELLMRAVREEVVL